MTLLADPAGHFSAGLALGALRLQRCQACGHVQAVAGFACRGCSSTALAWVVAGGAGMVQAASVVARAPSDSFRALLPYTLVLVRLDEGATVMGHALAGVQIGDRVQAGVFQHDGVWLLRFAPQPLSQ